MSVIKILAETADTVTVSRRDWASLLAELEDAEDRAAIRSRRAQESVLGKAAARQNYLTIEEARRLLEGERPLRVWREKRGLTQRALAAAAGVAASYLADIENGRKPGSADALSRLARALGVSMDDLMDEQQQQRSPGFGPVYIRYRPDTVGIGPSGRGAKPHERKFASVRDAWTAVRDEWQTLKNHSPEIVDEQRVPIFGQEDLWREMEPDLFTSNRKPSSADVKFDAAAQWSSRLSSYVMWAKVEGTPIRCRITAEVFRDCLDDPDVTPRDFPRLFRRHRQTFERAFRKAIQDGLFGSWLDREAGKWRQEVVLNDRDFHMLVGLGG